MNSRARDKSHCILTPIFFGDLFDDLFGDCFDLNIRTRMFYSEFKRTQAAHANCLISIPADSLALWQLCKQKDLLTLALAVVSFISVKNVEMYFEI